MQGFVVEREKVTPAVGIEFIIEEKVINLSGSYKYSKWLTLKLNLKKQRQS